MKTLIQSVTLPASPERLYRTYLSSKEHGAAIRDVAKVEPKIGGKVSAFGKSSPLTKTSRVSWKRWRKNTTANSKSCSMPSGT